MTPRETLDELAACRWDIARFARLLGLDPHAGQVRFWKVALLRDETLWRAFWLTICLAAGNRAGKTLALAVLVLHHTIFKIGMRPPNPDDPKELDAFSRQPYDWYHFGIQQEVGDLMFNAIVNLLGGNHEAQRGRGCPLTEGLGPIAKTDFKERGEYRWVVIDKVLGGGQIHFRTTAERGLGSLGKDMHGISFDECGFETNLYFIVNEVLHLRRLSTGGPMFLISTPSEGFGEFKDEWDRGDPEDPDHEEHRISLRMSTRENIGYGIDKDVFAKLVAGMPPHLVPQNIDGHFLQDRKAFFDGVAVDAMFVAGLPEMELPRAGHSYIQGIDPAATHDATWSIVLDRLDASKAQGVLAQRREGKQKVTDVVELLKTTHTTYSSGFAKCQTALDVTGMGGKMFKDMLSGIQPLRSVEFGGTPQKKRKLLTDLKAFIEQGRLRFPRTGLWLVLRRQLIAYRLDDKKLATDAVMALAVAAKLLQFNKPGSARDAPFSYFSPASPAPVPVVVEPPAERELTPEEAVLRKKELERARLNYRLGRAVRLKGVPTPSQMVR